MLRYFRKTSFRDGALYGHFFFIAEGLAPRSEVEKVYALRLLQRIGSRRRAPAISS